LEISEQTNLDNPPLIVKALRDHLRWGVLFDPGILAAGRLCQPYVEYWPLVKKKARAVDIHDFKTGDSGRPPGHGDGQLDLLMSDVIQNGYHGQLCFEAGVGRRYGNIIGKKKSFAYCLKCLSGLLHRISQKGALVDIVKELAVKAEQL
jgi:hypothetical protein